MTPAIPPLLYSLTEDTHVHVPEDVYEQFRRLDRLARRTAAPTFLPSDVVPENTLVQASTAHLKGDAGWLKVNGPVVYYAPRGRAGYPSPFERLIHPTPGYTTRTLGAVEAARDRRRRRR
jgi:hypothetical protein